jgi:hypothetical protein
VLVALFPGDGVGPEVIEQAARVLGRGCGDRLTFEEAPSNRVHGRGGPDRAGGRGRDRGRRPHRGSGRPASTSQMGDAVVAAL